MNFGSAKHPNCAGFTISQFQRLNFDKMDFSELSKLDNPNPVVALPWGSKSITKTFFPSKLKPAARFITVVVFLHHLFDLLLK